jgi:DNA-binding NarL/FixJ family response regulator
MTDTDALRRAIDAQARHLIACNLVEETLTARDHAILVALSLGASGADVARATGLTEGRISQLKRAAQAR